MVDRSNEMSKGAVLFFHERCFGFLHLICIMVCSGDDCRDVFGSVLLDWVGSESSSLLFKKKKRVL